MNYSIRTLYLASYGDGMYPEDNQNFGAYQTREEAEACNKKEVEYQRRVHGPNSERNTTKDHNYRVEDIDYMVPDAKLSVKEQKLVERLNDCTKELDVADRVALINLIDRLRVHEDPEDLTP